MSCPNVSGTDFRCATQRHPQSYLNSACLPLKTPIAALQLAQSLRETVRHQEEEVVQWLEVVVEQRGRGQSGLAELQTRWAELRPAFLPAP